LVRPGSGPGTWWLSLVFLPCLKPYTARHPGLSLFSNCPRQCAYWLLARLVSIASMPGDQLIQPSLAIKAFSSQLCAACGSGCCRCWRCASRRGVPPKFHLSLLPLEINQQSHRVQAHDVILGTLYLDRALHVIRGGVHITPENVG